MDARYSKLILRFFTEDVGGILITGKGGEVLYEDERTRLLLRKAPIGTQLVPRPARVSGGNAGTCCTRRAGKALWWSPPPCGRGTI